jgi:hypothetical protein
MGILSAKDSPNHTANPSETIIPNVVPAVTIQKDP